MCAEFNSSRESIMNSFGNPNADAIGVYKAIEEIYPAFSKKIFQNNAFMEFVVMSNYSPMHILEYPICGRCETLAMWDNRSIKNGKVVRACSCFAEGCGNRTINPITFREWLKDELKSKAPKSIVDNIEFCVDMVALSMMKRSLLETKRLQDQEAASRMRKLGTVDSFGNIISSDPSEQVQVTMTESDVPIDLDEEMKNISREEGYDYEKLE